MRPPARSAEAALLLAAALLAAPPALAVRPMTWTEPPSGLPRGELDSVAFGATGALMLGPKIDPLTTLSAASDPSGDRAIPDPILWCAAADPQGNLVMGTGHSGTVLQLGARGELTVLARLSEPEVTAVLVSRRGEIFAATSPNGAIYVLRKGKEAEVFYEPEERYIWSLAEDEAGNLFAGTGEKGKIFRITPRGEGSLFFDSPEPHITALAFGRDGALIAGSDGSGKVYRIDAQKTAKVLYDSNYAEISDLAVDGSGRIYASAVSGGVGEIPAPAPRLVVRSPEGEGPLLAPEDVTSPQSDATVRPREREAMQAELEGVLPGGQPRTRAREGGGAIFRILPDGKVEDLWRSSEEVPYTLAVSGEGALFAGTGEPARLLKIEEKGRALALARFPQDQLTALALDPSDRLYAVTSNAGGAYRLSRELADTGSYVSPVRDAGSAARWGRVRWDATVAAGQKVEIQTRSGNSSVPDETWSPWSPDYSDPEGSEIISPAARFIQWKARLIRPLQGRSSPVLRSVSLSYLPPNHPPRIRELRLLTRNETSTEGLPDAESEGRASTRVTVTAPPEPPPQGESGTPGASGDGKKAKAEMTGIPGSRSRIIVWHAEDPDNDKLVYRVLLQRDGEDPWSPVCSEVADSTCSFDETAWPEGRYRIKAVVTDAPSNFPGEALEADHVAEGALLDHTPPLLEKIPGPGGRLLVRASDLLSPIETAEIVNGDRVQAAARPVDGVLDSRVETLEIELPQGDKAGLRLRVRDASGNEATLDVSSP